MTAPCIRNFCIASCDCACEGGLLEAGEGGEWKGGGPGRRYGRVCGQGHTGAAALHHSPLT
ncbi:hypothetical protein E2C01_101225 [Portunus trituberculatus]|uniref:Uncharacterized protein n=1 Tax=Portunus trituberculatus TaxID=210409 RepID=A0A5B7KJX8_PORTR|nr:hypothetical protein [Portunus trituberculatus]